MATCSIGNCRPNICQRFSSGGHCCTCYFLQVRMTSWCVWSLNWGYLHTHAPVRLGTWRILICSLTKIFCIRGRQRNGGGKLIACLLGRKHVNNPKSVLATVRVKTYPDEPLCNKLFCTTCHEQISLFSITSSQRSMVKAKNDWFRRKNAS